jgi:hypothetical protein
VPITVIYIEELRQVGPLNAEDQTGYVWAFLDEAPTRLLSPLGALVIAGDGDAPAVAVVVDLVPHPNGMIVHLDVLPGAVDEYPALARRVDAQPDAVMRPGGAPRVLPCGMVCGTKWS